MNTILIGVGRILAQAIYEISENEKFIPMVAFINHNGTETITRCNLKNEQWHYEAAIKIDTLGPRQRGAVFIREQVISFEAGDVDSLLIDVRFSGSRSRRVQYCIPFRQDEELARFELSRLRLTYSTGFSHRNPKTIEDLIWQGIQQHRLGWKAVIDCYEETEHPSILKKHEGTGFTEEEFRKIRFAPIIVMHRVNHADNKGNAKKIAAIIEIKMSDHSESCLLMTRIFEESIASMWESLDSNKPDHPFALAELTELMDKNLSESEALIFKTTLMKYGNKIANASGGFLGFGNKVSAKEKSVLADIAVSLGLV